MGELLPGAMSGEAHCLDTEEACIAYLYRLRWPVGFSCPFCMCDHAYTISTRRIPLYECTRCKRQVSLTAGTFMDGSHLPLIKWMLAIRLVSDPERGISALTLTRILRVTYKTAWNLLHKIRQAMGETEELEVLTGEVVVNSASVGRRPQSSAEAHPRETPVLLGASVTQDGEPQRLKIRVIDLRRLEDSQVRPSGVAAFVQKEVARGASADLRYVKRYTPLKQRKVYPLFCQARRWMNQTFHGLGRKHLQAYLNEFCCRTNLQLANADVFAGIARMCTLEPIRDIHQIRLSRAG